MERADVIESVTRIAERFARDRHDRQRRRELDAMDFDELARAGFLLTGVPVTRGGLFESVPRSTRTIAELLRVLARGDSSVALVSSMHPAVLSFWLATDEVPEAHRAAWLQQRAEVTAAAEQGAWWGTMTSEPGSAGDVARTRAIARRAALGWTVSGQKHFGSGLGVTSYMITTAVPEGETAPDWFYVEVRGAPWDGSTGLTLLAPWDGHGMIATQSHGVQLEAFAARRFACPGNWRGISEAAGPFVGCVFAAVIVGIVETAVATARAQLGKKVADLRPYEQVEWSRAELEGWLIVQAYEGMLRAVEERRPAALREVFQGKLAIAELAESAMRRLCRIMGGGSFARHSPFGFWFEDVRALGWLRPPWALTFDALFATSWPT